MLCNGIKECVTIKKSGQPSEKIQKRLILYSKIDLYNKWIKATKSETIPSLPFFIKLQPKQCIDAGKPGTHNICVCSTHQNIKLKLAVIRPDLYYKEVIQSGVCSSYEEKCMLSKCSDCPNEDGIRKFLGFGIKNEDTKMVSYMQWSTEDEKGSLKRVSLEDRTEPFNVVFNSLIVDVMKMKQHHYVSHRQSEFYAYSRKNIEKSIGVITMDFAENYQFIAQNSTQGYYFNNTSATLFTVVLYYKEESGDEIKKQSFCVISNSGEHQAASVHAFLQPVLEELREKYHWIKSLKYFSDGAPTQFKNR